MFKSKSEYTPEELAECAKWGRQIEELENRLLDCITAAWEDMPDMPMQIVMCGLLNQVRRLINSVRESDHQQEFRQQTTRAFELMLEAINTNPKRFIAPRTPATFN